MDEYGVAVAPIMPLGMTNAFLVKCEGGVIAIDAGLPGSEKIFDKLLRRLGLGFSDIKLIIITHAHIDHAGAAFALRKLSGAPVLAHSADLPFFLQEEKMRFCPTGWFGRLFAKTGLISQPYDAFTPDILMNSGESMELADYGLNGTVHHTPGHTAGSISVSLASGAALVGDLAASGILLGGIICRSRAKRPPFEDDPHGVGQSLNAMIRKGGQKFYLGHGGPIIADEVQRHARYLEGL